MSTFIKGDGVILSFHDGTIYRPIACLTSNSLSQTRAVIESQTKCEPGEIQRDSGSQSYELSFEGQYIDTTTVATGDLTKASHDFLKIELETGGTDTWRLSTGLVDVPFYFGIAVLSELTLDAPAGDEFSTFSGTLSGSGLIVTVDPTV